MVSSFLAFTVSLAVLLAKKGSSVVAQQGNPSGACCADQHYLCGLHICTCPVSCGARIAASLGQQTIQGNKSVESLIQCSADHDWSS